MQGTIQRIRAERGFGRSCHYGPALATTAQFPDDAGAVARRAHAPGRRRVQPHPAGNNNPYCQDHELTWLNWQLTDGQRAWCDFVRAVIQVRRTQPVFRRRKFFQDRAIHGAGIQDISWFDATGQEMTEQDWQNGYVRCLGVCLAGDRIGGTDERSELVVGDTILLLMNAHYEVIPFLLPPLLEGQRWERVLDTAYGPGKTSPCEREQPYALQGRTMAVLRMTLQHDQVQHPLWTAAAEC
jgi:isoamylase